MKDKALSLSLLLTASCITLMLCVFSGLHAQELPYTIYGPQGYNSGGDGTPVNSVRYNLLGMELVDDVCYYIHDYFYSFDMTYGGSKYVGYINMPDGGGGLLTGTGMNDVMSSFLSPMQDGVVLGFVITYYGFKWNYYTAQTGMQALPYATFNNFNINAVSHVKADKIDENHVLVVFAGPSSCIYASCLDLNYNQVWGFSLANLNIPGTIAFGSVYAIDAQTFLIASKADNTLHLTSINSNGVIVGQTTVTDDPYNYRGPTISKTNIPGTFLVSYREAGIQKLAKYENGTLSDLFSITSIYNSTIDADADLNSIVTVSKEYYSSSSVLRKYNWNGDLIWSKVLPQSLIYGFDNLEIGQTGSIYLAMYSYSQLRYIIAKILSNGSDSYTSNDDPTSAPIVQPISISPNPFSATVNLSIKLDQADEIDLSIYNMRGQLVHKTGQLRATHGSLEYLWDAKDDSGSEVPTGIYMVRAKSQTGVYHSKCLKVD